MPVNKSKSANILSPKLVPYFNDYSSYHQTQGNQVTHYFGISFILISLFGLLGNWVILSGIGIESTYLRLDMGVVLIILSSIFYLILDWKLSTPFIFILSGMYFFGRVLPLSMNWILFVLGWILQGIGHFVFEKKAPAFSKNLIHLWIGPLWIFAKLIGVRSETKS